MFPILDENKGKRCRLLQEGPNESEVVIKVQTIMATFKDVKSLCPPYIVLAEEETYKDWGGGPWLTDSVVCARIKQMCSREKDMEKIENFWFTVWWRDMKTIKDIQKRNLLCMKVHNTPLPLTEEEDSTLCMASDISACIYQRSTTGKR